MVILGIDPGYAIVGYGVIEAKNSRYRPLEHGAVTTKSTQDFNGRLEVIYNSMEAILQKWKPDAVAIEKLFFNSNQKTAIQVAEARGVILLAAQKAGVSISEYTPLQVKQAVTGYGQAQKPQVMESWTILAMHWQWRFVMGKRPVLRCAVPCCQGGCNSCFIV